MQNSNLQRQNNIESNIKQVLQNGWIDSNNNVMFVLPSRAEQSGGGSGIKKEKLHSTARPKHGAHSMR